MATPVSEKLAGWTVNPVPPRESKDYAGSLFAGRYLLHRKIGGGGMSTIHEAQDATLGIRVAVKIMRDDLPCDPVDRFRREALVLAGLSHEHIARIIDRQDPEDGPRFLVTEYIDGLDLGLLRRRGPLPAAAVLQIGLQVSAALAHAHAAHVIHRDIKPSNLMLVRHSGGDIFVKVIDFGIAKLGRGSDLAAPPGARRETRGDAVLGTSPYWRGDEGPRRDLYALALTLAELLTGEAPDVKADLSREGVPPTLARTIAAALASGQSMDDFHRALRDVQDGLAAREVEAERRAYVRRALASAPDPEAAQAPAEAPRFGGHHIICGELGEGGMGRVQIAFDTENQRRVALKTIQPRLAGNKSLEARFRREGRALAAIEHTGVPILFESGTAPQPFFTMEIVAGVSLAAALKDGRMAPLRALGLAIALGQILCAAHEVGVIHRDVKPANIILGPGDRVRLIDFGACLLMPRFHQRHVMFPGTPPDERYITGEYEAVGTPGYTAPEILGREGGAGPRSDVYSVCIVLYEMLTGWSLIDRTTRTARTIERTHFPTALGPVVDLLCSGTAHEPADRPHSMTDLVYGLEAVRAGLLRRRQGRQLALVAAATLAVTAVITTWLVRAPADNIGHRNAIEHPHKIATTEPARSPEAPSAPAPMGAPPAVPDDIAGVAAAGAEPAPVLAPSDIIATPTVARQPDAPARKSSAPAPALTEASVKARLARRHTALRTCHPSMLVLDLAIDRGSATPAKINGMPFSDKNPTHTCIRDQLRGLRFPRTGETARFALTLDLRPPAPREP